MAPALEAGIARAKGAKRSGVRLGHWLRAEQAEQLLALPDLTTLKGIRDGAVLAILLGAGLRRSELASLDCEHVQQRDGRAGSSSNLAGKMGLRDALSHARKMVLRLARTWNRFSNWTHAMEVLVLPARA